MGKDFIRKLFLFSKKWVMDAMCLLPMFFVLVDPSSSQSITDGKNKNNFKTLSYESSSEVEKKVNLIKK